jgi:hypothetical protein
LPTHVQTSQENAEYQKDRRARRKGEPEVRGQRPLTYMLGNIAELDQRNAAEDDGLACKVADPFDVAGAPPASLFASSTRLANRQDQAGKTHEDTGNERHVSPTQFATSIAETRSSVRRHRTRAASRA